MHINYTFNLFLLAVMAVNAQTSDTVTDSGLQHQPLDKPAGLPKVEWDILRIDEASRENLCLRQTAYCSNNCGGPSQARKNFCNATSMAWGCACSGSVSDFAPYLWPVAQAECSGKAQDCQMMCTKDTIHPSTCAATCNAYYQCGTNRAPPSFLQTENPTDTPSYDGPKNETKPNNTAINATNSTGNHNNESSMKNSGNTLLESLFVLIVPLVMATLICT